MEILLSLKSVTLCMQALTGESEPNRIICCGHSLGAAVAALGVTLSHQQCCGHCEFHDFRHSVLYAAAVVCG